MPHRAPKVSVIVPVHNTVRFLQQCLDSLVNQTLTDIEILCIDDGSTDGSSEILSDFAARDPRVHILKQERKGAGAARNLGIATACGDYLAIFDSDDFFNKRALEETYFQAQETAADVVLFGGYPYNEASGTTGEQLSFIHERFLPAAKIFSARDIPNTIFQTTNPSAWSKLFRRSFVISNGLTFQELPNSNDVFFTYAALAIAPKITYVARPYVFYRHSTTTGTQDKRYLFPCCFLDALITLERFLEERGLFELLGRSYTKLAVDLTYANIELAHTEESRLEILEYLIQHETFSHDLFSDAETLDDPQSIRKCLCLHSALGVFGYLRAGSMDNGSERPPFIDACSPFLRAIENEAQLARTAQEISADEVADIERASAELISTAIAHYIELSEYEQWGVHGLISHRISFLKRVVEVAQRETALRKLKSSRAFRLGDGLLLPLRMLKRNLNRIAHPD